MSTRKPSVRPPSMAAQEARFRAANAIRLQRLNPSWSLTRAAREAHTTTGTVHRHMPKALALNERGRWHATTGDREWFRMRIVSVELGVTEAMVTGSRKRALVGRHHAAIGAYLKTGDRSGLDALTGQTVSGLTLETDPAVIRALFKRRDLTFLEIYTLSR